MHHRAYPFVRLHQDSSTYGVNSRELGDRKIDEVGWNKGNLTLAPGPEVRVPTNLHRATAVDISIVRLGLSNGRSV
jgi:hypothetical protein